MTPIFRCHINASKGYIYIYDTYDTISDQIRSSFKKTERNMQKEDDHTQPNINAAENNETSVNSDYEPYKSNILKEAEKIIDGNRREEYGDMRECFARISGLWSSYTGITITKRDVAYMMILLKVARLKNNNFQRDSLIDVIGYSMCADVLDRM